jgi:hypothetical protein
MAGGRPLEGKQQRYPELEELASWFHATLAAERAKTPRVTSWAEIPRPSLALRDLLEAQCASVERLP